MTQPIESVALVASTPAQAKVFIARLQAEGIPARTDGDSLVDEFAASRRLMNLIGTKVLVPTASLERARAILQPVAVDPAELEREALATPRERAPARGPDDAGARGASSVLGLLLLLAAGAALLFAVLWQRAAAQAAELSRPHPAFDYVPEGTSLREVRRRDGRALRLLHDPDGDGVHERQDVLDAQGNVLAIADDYHDGIYCRWTERRAGDLEARWVDADRDGVQDRATIVDRDGKTVQTIEWQPQRGFVIKAP